MEVLLMSTKATEESKRRAETAMGDLAKDVGLKHETGGLKDETQSGQSLKQVFGRLFGRVQGTSRKNS
jgi:hypothetical protein